mmetsp:Transcript_104109/g.184864  ORF Transcript_104109/g.184864 Transcript_104109/m.184864 type:complete len:87 (-) Transcript_104109:613-873(-)
MCPALQHYFVPVQLYRVQLQKLEGICQTISSLVFVCHNTLRRQHCHSPPPEAQVSRSFEERAFEKDPRVRSVHTTRPAHTTAAPGH